MTLEHEPEKPAILLVDDEPEILVSLKGLLRREFRLFTAETGDAALEILGSHSIHVIMTDQRMPQMTGAELLMQAKQQSPDSIRIVFTGYADIKAVVDAINQGLLYRYITKPWDPDDLVETLHEAAEEYSKQKGRRQLLCDVNEFLAEMLSSAQGDASRGGAAALQERAESLRSQVESEIELDKHRT